MAKRTPRHRRKLAGDTLPPSPIIGTNILREYFVPWLDEVDARVGRDARTSLGRGGYSWLASWSEGLTPTQAIAEALDYMQARDGARGRS